MTHADKVKQRVEKLRELIEYHRHLYHVEDRLEISEEALDSLKKELFDLEQKHPELVTPDSPTQRVAGSVAEGFNKVVHRCPNGLLMMPSHLRRCMNLMIELGECLSEKVLIEYLPIAVSLR